MRRIVLTLALSAGLLSSTVAHGQETTRKAQIVGWTGTGQEIVVETEVQGEVMVDAAAEDFYYAATELYRGSDGEFIRRFRRGEPAGHRHAEFEAAKPAEELKKYLDNVGLMEASTSAESPDGRWFIDTTHHSRTRQDDEGFRCETRLRTLLFDRNLKRASVVSDTRERGEPASSEREARCPRIAVDVHWHPGSTDWLLEETITRSNSKRWTLKPGRVDKLDAFPEAPFETTDYAAEWFEAATKDEEIRAAWAHVFRGELAEAKTKLTAAEDSSPEKILLLALVIAMEGDGKAATRAAAQAFKSAPKDAYHEALLAAVWTAAGDAKRASRHVAKALEQAKTYREKMRLGALFTLVDLSVANQLFIHALSDPGDVVDTTDGYVILAHTLIDARQLAAAEDLLGKYGDEKPTPIRLAAARLALEKGSRAEVAKESSEILEREPAQCLAHRLLARSIAPEEPSRALGHFRAAVVCDDTDVESLFMLGGLELEAGRLEAARVSFEQFLKRAINRREDELRSAQRELAEEIHKRLAHRGAVLSTVTCRPLGPAKLCQGVVFNTSENPLDAVEVIVSESKGKKRKTLAKGAVDPIPPGESRAFGVRVENSSGTLLVSVGASAAEHEINRMPAR